MITNFKNKEQLKEEKTESEIEALKPFFSEKEHGRIGRVFKDEAKGNDRLVISNNVIKIKFKLREVYKIMNKLYSDKKEAEEALNCDLTSKNREAYKKYLDTINEYIQNLKDMILSYGTMLIHSYIPMMDKYFTEHEIIQIISGSHEQCKRIKEFYDKHDTGTKLSTDRFIIHHGEYRWRRGLSKDFIDCPRWEMPLFECISEVMWKEINENPKARADMDNFFEDNFADAMAYTTTDAQGNITSVEKIYQKLTAKELIKGYKGSFINELKQKNIFDDETSYRIKRVDNGVYDVILENGKATYKIYKKVI